MGLLGTIWRITGLQALMNTLGKIAAISLVVAFLFSLTYYGIFDTVGFAVDFVDWFIFTLFDWLVKFWTEVIRPNLDLDELIELLENLAIFVRGGSL